MNLTAHCCFKRQEKLQLRKHETERLGRVAGPDAVIRASIAQIRTGLEIVHPCFESNAEWLPCADLFHCWMS